MDSVAVVACGHERDATDPAQSADAFMLRRFPAPLRAADVARAIVSIASGEERPEATRLTVTANGIEAI